MSVMGGGGQAGPMPNPMPAPAPDQNANQGNAATQEIKDDVDQLNADNIKAAKNYIEDMLEKQNGGEDQEGDAGMPPAPEPMPAPAPGPKESRFNFKSIIDETFSTIFGDGNPSNFENGTTRPEGIVGEDALTELDNPFLPR